MTSSLQGKRIVITRAAAQADDMATLLAAKGAQALLYPCIDIQPPADTHELDAALTEAAQGKFDWLIVTSPNVVVSLAQRIQALNLTLPQSPWLRIAAVGTATGRLLMRLLNLSVHLIPSEYRGDALAKAIQPLVGQSVLLPQSDLAPDTIGTLLEQKQLRVRRVTAYRTVLGTGGVNLGCLLAERVVDAITFASPSAVNNLMTRFEQEHIRRDLLNDVKLAAIGPTTAEALHQHDLPVHVMPPMYTISHLVNSLEAAYT
jgi:uroporphyrinogen III methyltransferase/synthase